MEYCKICGKPLETEHEEEQGICNDCLAGLTFLADGCGVELWGGLWT